MNWDLARTLHAQRHHSHHCDAHAPANVMSRRQFARTTAGAAAGALALGMMPRAVQAQKKEAGVPVPIPGGTPVLGGGYQVFGPAAIDPVDAEPISITDFNGFVGLAYINGMVTQKNKKTGEIKTYPMIDSDMRFMTGVYRGSDGRVHQGSFAFV